MDTRTKIFESGATVVAGHFDPLTAAHTRRLAELKRPGQPLIVVVTSPPRPVMPARARAELVAALAAVDRVIVAEDFADERSADAERAAALIEHVRSRQ